ncbi:hypothetical protein [Methanolacinia petrolearia]|uniref:hypothetical protein n=1 Tax=Methanolacinia petrolearia TaxID=54120 RepID=UPI003BAA1E03
MKGLADKIFYDPRMIALMPSAGIIIDYTLTFIFAGGSGNIMMYEFSPIMRLSAASGLIFPVMLVIAGFYYFAALTGLKVLLKSAIYPFGVAIATIVMLTHIMGAFSWIIKNQAYAYTVFGMSIMMIIIAFTAFLYSALLKKGAMCQKYIQ